ALGIFLGYLINFQLDYIIGLTAFFLEYNNGVRMGVRMVMNLAGGMVIPLDYLRGSGSAFIRDMGHVFRWLPTQYMFFQPMQAFLGRSTPAVAWAHVGLALAWVLGLLVCAQLLQRRGLRALSISGG